MVATVTFSVWGLLTARPLFDLNESTAIPGRAQNRCGLYGERVRHAWPGPALWRSIRVDWPRCASASAQSAHGGRPKDAGDIVSQTARERCNSWSIGAKRQLILEAVAATPDVAHAELRHQLKNDGVNAPSIYLVNSRPLRSRIELGWACERAP